MQVLSYPNRKKVKSCSRSDCAQANPQPVESFHKTKSRHDGLHPYCKTCMRRLNRQYSKANPEKTALRSRKSYLKYFYGITLEQYETMLTAQNYGCAICKTHHSKFEKSLHVDHCHVTDRIRQLLCSNCNFVIGYAQENTEILKTAIAYLERHND